jgi:hypothetical protein
MRVAFNLFVPVVIFAYPVLQIAALIYCRGALRRLSALPLPVAAWLVWGWIQFRNDAPNTNLYPILPIFICPMLNVYLLTCILSEMAKRATKQKPPPRST